MSEEARHIVCPNCTSVNRIPSGQDARKAKCGHCHEPLFTGRPTPASAKSFATYIQRNDIPVVVDFWAQWCGPCKEMAPVYKRVASEFEPEVRLLKVDTEAEPELSARDNIRSIPTLLLFRNGNVVARNKPEPWARKRCAPGCASTRHRPHRRFKRVRIGANAHSFDSPRLCE